MFKWAQLVVWGSVCGTIPVGCAMPMEPEADEEKFLELPCFLDSENDCNTDEWEGQHSRDDLAYTVWSADRQFRTTSCANLEVRVDDRVFRLEMPYPMGEYSDPLRRHASVADQLLRTHAEANGIEDGEVSRRGIASAMIPLADTAAYEWRCDDEPFQTVQCPTDFSQVYFRRWGQDQRTQRADLTSRVSANGVWLRQHTPASRVSMECVHSRDMKFGTSAHACLPEHDRGETCR